MKCPVLRQSEFLISLNIYYPLSIQMYHHNSSNNYQDSLYKFYIMDHMPHTDQIANFKFPSKNIHHCNAYKHFLSHISCMNLDIYNIPDCSSKKYRYTQYIDWHLFGNIGYSSIQLYIEHKFLSVKPIGLGKQNMNCYRYKKYQADIFSQKIICIRQNITNKFNNQIMNICDNLIGKDLHKCLLSKCNLFYIFYRNLNSNIKNIWNHIFYKLHFLSINHSNKHWHIGRGKFCCNFYNLQNIVNIFSNQLW